MTRFIGLAEDMVDFQVILRAGVEIGLRIR